MRQQGEEDIRDQPHSQTWGNKEKKMDTEVRKIKSQMEKIVGLIKI